MASYTGVVKGVLGFIIGIFFILTTYYIIPDIIDVMDDFGDAETSALLKTIFWTGYIILLILAVVVIPAKIITEEKA